MTRQGGRREATGAGVRGTAAVEVVPAEEWDALVRRLGGDMAYGSLGYHRASALLEPPGSVPVLLRHDGKAESALPLLLRPLPDGTGWDATTAYGYGGPLASAARGDPAFGAAVDEWARTNGVVATFVRYHPLLRNHRLGPTGARVVRQGATAVWSLRGQRDLLQGMHHHHRRAARRADRAGLRTAVTVAPRDLGAFRTLYESTMRRQGAHRFYFFPDAYWDELAARCSTSLVLCGAYLDDTLAAALLCLYAPPFLHYHLGASSDAGRCTGASNRLFLATAEWARDAGVTAFHLGGGVGGCTDSPLFVFKCRFDPSTPPVSFHTGSWVHDPARYRELAGCTSTAGFFPPWRR